MKISVNELKKYVKTLPDDIDELVSLIGSRLVEVESVDDWSEKYHNIYIVKVLSEDLIPGTHLHLCQVDAGEELNQKFGDGATVQIVCGAPNVHQGMFAAWIAPGAIVPMTFGKENFKIDTKKLMGHDSNGMLAAADELALGDEHDGIIELNPEMKIPDGSRSITPGDSFAEVYGLNDQILDIENKSLTHRPDCFGYIGFAREVAGILGEKFDEPDFWQPEHKAHFDHLREIIMSRPEGENTLEVKIEDGDLCPVYLGAILDLKNSPFAPEKKSSYFTPQDVFLIKSGMRPVSPIVDLTNLIMLETGQPLHAFDYDKFVSVGQGTFEHENLPEIKVRAARRGEKLELLDQKTITLTENDIIICSGDVPVALAGAMGGLSTAIDEKTQKIILEVASFSLYHLRSTQMAHGIFSEAITRFTKGQPATIAKPVMIESIYRYGADNLLALAMDSTDDYTNALHPAPISLTLADINNLLGTSFSAKEVKETLLHVGFEVEGNGDFKITAPFWRTDIAIREDIIEEVGRLKGFDNITLSLPLRPFIESEIDPIFALKTKLRNLLSDRFGANEILTYSFISRNLEQKVGENIDDCYEIANSISPELELFRQTLTPSLLSKVRQNLKSGFDHFTIYELNQVTNKSLGLDEDGVPNYETHLAILTTGDYYAIKALAEDLFSLIGVDFSIVPAEHTAPYFEPKHSVDLPFGSFGEIKQSVLSSLKIAQPISALELNLAPLLSAVSRQTVNMPALSKYPSVTRDFTFAAPEDVSFEELQGDLLSAISAEADLISNLTTLSIYQPEGESSRHISFRLTFSSTTHTLSADEISAIIERITSSVKKARLI